jgi:hypothetical protein
LLKIHLLNLRRQTETDTGSAGEQPVRDKFDRPKNSKKGIDNQSLLTFSRERLCLKKPIYKLLFTLQSQSVMVV